MIFSININVHADLAPFGFDSYAHEATVGSTVTYSIAGFTYEGNPGTNLNGKIVYDTTMLEFVEIYMSKAGTIADEIALPDVKVIKNQSGTLQYKIENEDGIYGQYDVKIDFKVKAIPTEGDLSIKFYPDDKDALYSGDHAKLSISVLGNTSVEEPIEEEDTVVEDEPIVEDETAKEEPKKDTTIVDDTKCENDNTFLYVAIVSGILNLILIIILIVKSSKKKTVQTQLNESNNSEIKE